MPNDNPACADCKAKKKRCIHRNQPVKVAEAEVVPASMSPLSDPAVPTPALTPAPTPAPTPAVALGAATRGRRKAAEAAEAKPKETSPDPAPAESNDELSSVPSGPEEQPVVKKSIKRRRPKFAKSQNGIPDFPADSLQAASTMSVHRVWARELEGNLEELQRNLQAFDDAHRATMASAQNIQRTVDGWIQTWAATGR
ncbi:uncharacterized protein N7500_000239 [Penicillium coprophilum]|uniref:uncharacterized protein n=1 Tax=Penicillium coprophilum TaxID=36646 RepID=UPI0023976DF4|nr:uncharacterized protein N7500_000239 [Penicillium coprophilum]KAJ5177540.1 hypothetical protein N7500_000239 [Penicillium coprophilum]